MTEVFLDTSFAIAVTVSTDRYHSIASRLATNLRESRVPLVTTQGILAEIADSFSKPPYRAAAVTLLHALEHDPLVTILPIDGERFARGSALFVARPDKTWGLTDCISFHVMKERGVTDALTTDRHFQQAGFRALLREEAA
jgi:predicted nucleic acid-binding protein